jgi:multiple sugar transport system permease protein
MRYARRWQKVVFFVALSAAAFVSLYPLLWMVGASFLAEREIFDHVGLIPRSVSLDNYVSGWRGVGGVTFTTYFVNTLILVVLRIAGTLLSCSMAAYAFARLDFTGKRVLFPLVLLTMMLPFHVTVVPQYVMFFRMGWVGSIKPLVVPAVLASGSFFIVLMVQFMRGLPVELDQAALVDGCSVFDIYWRIILPLSAPALVTAAIFVFIWTWNDFFSQLLYLTRPGDFTVALGLRGFMDASAGSAYGQLFAMSIVSLIPVVGFFVAFQRLLIEDISTTGWKG